MSTPEGRIKDKVKKKLKLVPRRYSFWPVQTGMGAKTLDCLLCINGRFVAIETKAPGKDLTELQKVHRAEIEAAGGIVLKIDGDISMMVALERLMALCLS